MSLPTVMLIALAKYASAKIKSISVSSKVSEKDPSTFFEEVFLTLERQCLFKLIWIISNAVSGHKMMPNFRLCLHFSVIYAL